MKQLSINIESIFSRSSSTKARNYMQEVTEPYLKEINWQNFSLDKDTQAFWIAANRCYKRKTHAEYVKILDWMRGKNLHPLQAIKLLNRT